ncbi:NAD(P)-dependent oxidoreductase [Embleya scabrispora]|uniref:NAD(P)-dependent oxidoreductase n=1 Tax=Embleya scabrispora TaxID=159449 RepID=UPI00039B36C0|nr:NAD(P)-binding domain-containing protein [Embleya scabrispora]MYS82324.1 NAD(P)-binding domain-containing protein [Streptomyces sp. SID5474]
MPASPVRPATSVTVLGLGAMGTAPADALLAAGHPVTVWNRSPARADGLVARGAKRADSAAEAVAASALVIVCVTDYDIANTILADASTAGGADLWADRTLVNLTSDTPERAREAAAWAAKRDIAYLDGAIMVPASVVGTANGLVLYSGSRAAFEAHGATLRVFGPNTPFLGEDHGLAAVYDLGMLDFFYTSLAGLTHAFGVVGADGVSAGEFLPFANIIFGILPNIMTGMAASIDAGAHPGDQGNLIMEATGIDHILTAAKARGLDVGVLEAVKHLTDRTIARGHGSDGFTATIETIRNP